MTKVDNFRAFNLYKRSIDLTKTTYDATNSNQNNFTDAEALLIRKKALTISNKIASAIVQVNMTIRFKKLNEAKVALIQLQSVMMDLKKKNKIANHSWQDIENCSTEIMKLLHGYFGWLKDHKRSV